jgi:hypothetical protein
METKNMTTEWLEDVEKINGVGETCFPCEFAEFVNNTSGEGFICYPEGDFIFRATNCGSSGNLINFNIAGHTLGENMTLWNANNPLNTIYLVVESCLVPADILNLMLEVKCPFILTGGKDEKCYNIDTFNTKEDFEVLNGLFVGRIAHRSSNDIKNIQNVKMWDLL